MEKFNISIYKKELKTKKLGRNIIYFDSIDSTNNYALSLQSELQACTLILSEKQTRGRGRFNSEWKSPEGGLWFTLILESLLEPIDLPKITILSAYAVTESLKDTCGLEVNIKWPNDIYYGKKKLGGILAETQNMEGKTYIYLGIGLNVNLDLEDLGQYSATSTSVKQLVGQSVSREKLLAQIVYLLENTFREFEDNKDFAHFFKKIEKILIY